MRSAGGRGWVHEVVRGWMWVPSGVRGLKSTSTICRRYATNGESASHSGCTMSDAGLNRGAASPRIALGGYGGHLAVAVLAVMLLAAGLGLGWRAVQRYEALQSNAEDLGFTDQILWNLLHGQFFRFTTYEYAEFLTDIDLKAVKRPNSLLA